MEKEQMAANESKGGKTSVKELREQIRSKDVLIQQLKDDNSKMQDQCNSFRERAAAEAETRRRIALDCGQSEGIANSLSEMASEITDLKVLLRKSQEEEFRLKGNVKNLVKALEQQNPKSLANHITHVMEWAKSKGWEPDDKRTFGDECTLLHTEISEAFEAYRKHGFNSWTETDKRGHAKPEGVQSEFADLFIRLCHYCGVHEIDLEYWFNVKMSYNKTRELRHGGKRA